MTVLLVRPQGSSDDDARAIRARGLAVVADPYVEVTPSSDPDARARVAVLLDALSGGSDWCIVTSASGPRAMVAIAGMARVSEAIQRSRTQGTRFAAVGPTSARSLTELGADEVLVPLTGHTASALLAALSGEPSGRVVLPRSSIGDALLPSTLQARGWEVVQEVVYETTSVRRAPASAARLRAGGFSAVVLRSPSAARAVVQWAGEIPPSTAVVAGGPTTALAAARAGLRVAAVAASSEADDIAEAVVGAAA